MSLIQTHQAPDLLSMDEIEDEATKVKTRVARVGKVVAPIEKAGRRETDGYTKLLIALEDMRRLAKEAYRLGWNAKTRHLQDLRAQENQEIGT